MNITCIGLDHNSADIELRGRVTFTESRYDKAYSCFKANRDISGCIIISTCNRTELYISSRNQKAAFEVYDFLRSFFDLKESELKHFFTLSGKDAIMHLFRVASGLESMVLGEDQILSQVKTAQSRANEHDAADAVLNRFFRDAITCAKEIKHRTAMSQNKLSVASLAIDAIVEHLGSLEGRRAMVVGIGEMSKLTIKNLLHAGINDIILINRTRHKANELLALHPELGFIEYNCRYEHLSGVDIVVTSTSAPHHVFEYEKVKAACADKALVMVDLAVPRDIEGKVAAMDNITLIDMDTLKLLAQHNAELRKELSHEAENIISEYEKKLYVWMEESELHILLSRIDRYIDNDVAMQAEALIYKEGYDDSHYQAEMKDYGLSLANRTLKKLALKIRSLPQDKGTAYVHMLEELLS